MKEAKMIRSAKDAKYESIIITGITLSGMLRTFEKEAKEKLLKKLPGTLEEIYKVKSADEFDRIHMQFCEWGCMKIRRNSKAGGLHASYGQIAKTLNVILKVIIYYANYPTLKDAKRISSLLHAAVDNKMMRMLIKEFPNDIKIKPVSLIDIDEGKYAEIRSLVNRFICEKHPIRITPVQFDDIYWLQQNRKLRVRIAHPLN